MNDQGDNGSVATSVLLLGGTGRVGRLVLAKLLDRGVEVRAVVRSAARLPQYVAGAPRPTVVDADLLSMPSQDVLELVRGCDAAVCCLGHTTSIRGIFGPPFDLVTRSIERVCQAAQELKPATPLRLALLSSVSVNQPGRLEARRGPGERAFLAAIRALVPPARDNQVAADFLVRRIGQDSPSVSWAAIRPDTLVEGVASGYALSGSLVDGLFKPGRSTMSNVAAFIADLVTDAHVWDEWAGKMPVVTDKGSLTPPAEGPGSRPSRAR
jgi:nucleoside-diphosphate-sugar epimerase